MALHVPESIYPGLKALAELDDASADQLAQALSEALPAGLGNKLASEISSRLGEPFLPDVTEILHSLVSLHAGRLFHDMATRQFVAEVIEGLHSKLSRDDTAKLARRVERLLGLDGSLSISTRGKTAPPTSQSHRNRETAASPKGKRKTVKKPRRRMGKDVIWVADDFNAPLSPEEEELFGLWTSR